MATSLDYARKYASLLQDAIRKDRINIRLGTTSRFTSLNQYHVVHALKAIGPDFDTLIYSDTNESLSEKTKTEIIEEIAKQLEYPEPTKIRRLIRGGSVDSLLQMSQEIEALLKSAK